MERVPPSAEPPTPPEPITFRLLRPVDLVDLRCTAVGCRLVADAPPPPPTQPPLAHHTVVAGDTLWDIAIRFYGDGALFPLIAAANHIPNPNLIFPGQALVIPALIEPDGTTAPPTYSGSHLVAESHTAHLIVIFGPQNIYEQSTIADVLHNPPAIPEVARAIAANDSRIVFELPQGTAVPFTTADILSLLTTLGLRVAPLAVPRPTATDPRTPEATVEPSAPGPDVTAIEAPYRIIVSPDIHGGFTHSALPAAPPGDPNRTELWHTRLGVRRIVDGTLSGVDDQETPDRIVRAIWTRDTDNITEPSYGSLNPSQRRALVRESANPIPNRRRPNPVEPEPLTVEKLHLSALGASIDWHGEWRTEALDNLPDIQFVSAYRHLAPMGRDAYVRVETPVYFFPLGHRGTLVKLTERRITAASKDAAANLFTRYFLIVRQHTRSYTERRLPFTSISLDPVISPDVDQPNDPTVDCFVPQVGGTDYRWTLTATDWAGRTITLITPLVVVPQDAGASALSTWNAQVASQRSIDVGGAEVAFAPSAVTGDTTLRMTSIDLTGDVDTAHNTSTPWMAKGHCIIPALSAINRGGAPTPMNYHSDYVTKGLRADDPAQMFLKLETESALDFSRGSDRGGGFIQPSVAINALSRTQGAVGDAGAVAGGIADGQFDPAAFLGNALPKLFGLFELTDLLRAGPLSEAPKLITDQLDLIAGLAADHADLAQSLTTARDTLAADIAASTATAATERLQALRDQVDAAIATLDSAPIQPLLDALTDIASGKADASAVTAPATNITSAVAALRGLVANPFLPALLRARLERPIKAIDAALKLVDKAAVVASLANPLANNTIRYDWTPTIKAWGPGVDPDKPEDRDKLVFIPAEPSNALAITVQIRTGPTGQPQSDVSAQLRNFRLQLLPGEPLMAVVFSRIGFRMATGGKPEVDVQFDKLEFLGALGFIEKLRQAIPFDGFADPPYVDISTAGATAGFDLALPSVAIGVFTLENIALSADCRIPFLGEAVTVGFGFCSKESPFRMTVLAIGGGGWVGIRLSPKGLVALEMGLEAGASLSVDLGVASGSVSVMIGVYLRLEGDKGQLTAYFRIRGEVEVLGIASASITLELSLTYDFDSGKLVGRASLVVDVEVAFFSASVSITCERKLAGSKGDPTLIMILPPGDGGQSMWDDYFSSFVIGV